MAKVVGLASLYEPLEFLENRIANLNQCNMKDVLVHWCDCSSNATWEKVEKIIREKCQFEYRADHHPERKTIYWTWNWIIENNAGAKYFTNINVDDIHHPEYFQKLAAYLDEHSQIVIVSVPWLVTKQKNQIWPPAAQGNTPPDPKRTLGHFPMWRSETHHDVGLFDPRMLTIGDSDFWRRIRIHRGQHTIAVHPEYLACYLSHAANAHHSLIGPNGQRGEGYDRALQQGRFQVSTWMSQVAQLLGKNPILFEIGGHLGEDTVHIHSTFKEMSPRIYTFEPDPRNVEHIRKVVKFPDCITFIDKAVGNENRRATFHLSSREDRPWTHSSSLRQPKEHLTVYPWVKFNETVEVDVVRLETFCKENNIPKIDFIWADVQGSENTMIEGAGNLIDGVRFMYLEADDRELYEGQWRISEMVECLSNCGWGVARLLAQDILFYNRRFFKDNPIRWE